MGPRGGVHTSRRVYLDTYPPHLYSTLDACLERPANLGGRGNLVECFYLEGEKLAAFYARAGGGFRLSKSGKRRSPSGNGRQGIPVYLVEIRLSRCDVQGASGGRREDNRETRSGL